MLEELNQGTEFPSPSLPRQLQEKRSEESPFHLDRKKASLLWVILSGYNRSLAIEGMQPREMHKRKPRSFFPLPHPTSMQTTQLNLMAVNLGETRGPILAKGYVAIHQYKSWKSSTKVVLWIAALGAFSQTAH